jgi:hypothetical protein
LCRVYSVTNLQNIRNLLLYSKANKTNMSVETLPPQAPPSESDNDAELELSHEQLSRQAFDNALSQYVAGRAGDRMYQINYLERERVINLVEEIETRGDIPSTDIYEDGKVKSHRITEAEAAGRVVGDLAHEYDKLEVLGGVPDRPASLTIAVPFAIRTEDPQLISNLIMQIQHAQEQYGGPVDVVLWNNALINDDDPDKASKIEDVEIKHAVLNEAIKDLSSSEVRILSGIDQIEGRGQTKSIIDMNDVRGHQMSAITYKVFQENADFMHPVLWLDADTIDLSKNALKAIDDEVRSGRTLLPHLETKYGIEQQDEGLSHTDDITRSIAVNEIMRRIATRGKSPDKRTGYYEESGMAFAIGTYLTIGGVELEGMGNSEAHNLTRAAQQAAQHRRYNEDHEIILTDRKGKVDP